MRGRRPAGLSRCVARFAMRTTHAAQTGVRSSMLADVQVWPSNCDPCTVNGVSTVHGTSAVHGLVSRSIGMRLMFYHGSWCVLCNLMVARIPGKDSMVTGHFDFDLD